MSTNCLVIRRSLTSVLTAAQRHLRTSAILCAALLISASNAQTNPFPLEGLIYFYTPQTGPALELSGLSDTIKLSWHASGSNFVVESSSDLGSGVWARETNAVIDVIGDQTLATVPLTSHQRFFRLHGPQTYLVPIFSFAIFYNNLLEFTWNATFTVNGRVHANGDIYVGSSANLTFNSAVSTAGGIYKTNWDGHTVEQMTGNVTYNGNPNSMTNVRPTCFMFRTNNAAGLREMIDPPPPGEDPGSLIGSQRYYNLAGVVLLVSNATVTAFLKTSATNDLPIIITVATGGTNSASLLTTFPFLSVTDSFTDQREFSKTAKVTQIDVAKYSKWCATNSAVLAKFPLGLDIPQSIRLLYVADLRTGGENTNLYSVRLVNGAVIPTNTFFGRPGGWTVATPNPLYIWGNYNIGPGGSTTPGNTDTSKTYPAALISDALTILSANWTDSSSSGTYASRDAASTTVNAAILTGIVYSTDSSSSHYSGGVMNLPRLLEDWQGSAAKLTLNTSFVNLFDSARATNRFQNPGVYYSAPTRFFSLDSNFTNIAKLPPFTLTVSVDVPPQSP